jgi:hypothetical protein
MAAVQDQQPVEDAKGNGESSYLIFKRVDNQDGRETWQKLGEITAVGAHAAREKAIEQFDLMQAVRESSLEMVSLGARFWMPKQPKVNVSESLDVT